MSLTKDCVPFDLDLLVELGVCVEHVLLGDSVVHHGLLHKLVFQVARKVRLALVHLLVPVGVGGAARIWQ